MGKIILIMPLNLSGHQAGEDWSNWKRHPDFYWWHTPIHPPFTIVHNYSFLEKWDILLDNGTAWSRTLFPNMSLCISYQIFRSNAAHTHIHTHIHSHTTTHTFWLPCQTYLQTVIGQFALHQHIWTASRWKHWWVLDGSKCTLTYSFSSSFLLPHNSCLGVCSPNMAIWN